MTHEIITVCQDDDGQRLDRLLRRLRPDLPFILIQKLLRKGQIRIDGKRAEGEARVKEGSEIRLPPREITARVKPSAGRHDAAWLKQFIIHEDDYILALNKPAGLSVQGGSGIRLHLEMLLPEFALHHVRPRLVHRLDRETSGVMIIARRSSAARALTDQFAARTTQKTYMALVSPPPRVDKGHIDAPLAKVQSGKDVEKIRVTRGGQSALTSYRVVAVNAEKTAALVAFYPHTGRTHQIRVHAAHARMPLVGDKKYEGSMDFFKKGKEKPRVMLHAAALSFTNPKDGQRTTFTADLPSDMRAVMAAAGIDQNLDIQKWIKDHKDE